jgi:hypothetical protein
MRIADVAYAADGPSQGPPAPDTHMVHGRYTSPGERSLHVYMGEEDEKGAKVRRRQKSHATQAVCVTVAALCGLLCLWCYPGAPERSGGHTPRLHGVEGSSSSLVTSAVRTQPFTAGGADGDTRVVPAVLSGGVGSVGSSGGEVVHPEKLRRVLVASHGRLQWLDVDSGECDIIHEGRGVYYGLAPDGQGPHTGRVWVVSRPHNWRVPEGAKEAALLLDTQSGALLREVALPSLFTHDMVRCGDKVRHDSVCVYVLHFAARRRAHHLLTLPMPRSTWRTQATGLCGSCGPVTWASCASCTSSQCMSMSTPWPAGPPGRQETAPGRMRHSPTSWWRCCTIWGRRSWHRWTSGRGPSCGASPRHASCRACLYRHKYTTTDCVPLL